MENLIAIDGMALPVPDAITVTIMDLDGESERNSLGQLIRDRVATKRKVEVEYKKLDGPAMRTVLEKVEPVFFALAYPDPYTGGRRTITAYCGDRSVPIKYIRNGQIYWNVKLSMTER